MGGLATRKTGCAILMRVSTQSGADYCRWADFHTVDFPSGLDRRRDGSALLGEKGFRYTTGRNAIEMGVWPKR